MDTNHIVRDMNESSTGDGSGDNESIPASRDGETDIPAPPRDNARERVSARRRSRHHDRRARLGRSKALRVGVVVVVVIAVLAVLARPLSQAAGRLARLRAAATSAGAGRATGSGATGKTGATASDGSGAGGSKTGAGAGGTDPGAASDSGSPDTTQGPPLAVRDSALPYPGPVAVTPETIVRGHPKTKLVAITLDDGIPFDMRLLELLEENGVRGTTFVLGEFAADRPDLIKRLVRDGFEIANHSYNHPFLTKLSDAEVVSQLERSQRAISKVTGDQAPYLRPPYGATSSRIKALAAKRGYRIVLWNRTFADTSRSATPEQLYKNVMNGLAPGDIILCHWGGRDTYEAMKLILPEMRRRGFKPVTLSEMLAESRT